jgi:predicted DNA-binding transcriptional regulator AlpA
VWHVRRDHLAPGRHRLDVLDVSPRPGRIVTRDVDSLLAALEDVAVERLPELIGALETAKARAWARLTAPAPGSPSVAEHDETVDVDDAARLLGMSRSWVYRHASRLPFTRRVGRRALRFSTSGIRRYLAVRVA